MIEALVILGVVLGVMVYGYYTTSAAQIQQNTQRHAQRTGTWTALYENIKDALYILTIFLWVVGIPLLFVVGAVIGFAAVWPVIVVFAFIMFFTGVVTCLP